MRPAIVVLPAMFALAACDGNAPQPGPTESNPAPAFAEPEMPPPITQALPIEGAEPPADDRIPDAIQGRWGLTAADCEPGRADAKGLLAITDGKLEFYESVGTLTGIEEAGASRIRAAFNFTGEGMTWQRDLVLDVQDQGKTLIRREYGEDAAPGPFRYVKCS